jgi:hypothetical protein
MLDFDRPPIPPLASINPYVIKDMTVLDVEQEAWGEGADTRWKAYQQLRSERKRFYAEQKEMKKHRRRMRRKGVDPNSKEHDNLEMDWKKDLRIASSSSSDDDDLTKEEQIKK